MWAKDLRHRFAPEDLAAEEREQHQRRYLSMGRRWDGMTRIEGMLDPEGAATLRVAMEGLLGPRPKGDERTPGQRWADGLVGIARKLQPGAVDLGPGFHTALPHSTRLEMQLEHDARPGEDGVAARGIQADL